MPIPGSFVEPTARRIRVRLGDAVVADSRRARLLIQYGPDALPTYFLPRADVRPDALIEESAGANGRRMWTVRAGSDRVPCAAWEFDDPTGPFAALADHVTFSWWQLRWFEEDEQVFVHARDPHKRVDALHSSRRVEVFVAGTRVADSVHPVLLFETYLPTRHYLPFADVRTELLVASDTVTACPYKGQARYWSIRLGDTVVADVAWSYPDPIPENPKIRDLLCFFDEKVDLIIDGIRQERPVTPWS